MKPNSSGIAQSIPMWIDEERFKIAKKGTYKLQYSFIIFISNLLIKFNLKI